jgi:hypothetical protein
MLTFHLNVHIACFNHKLGLFRCFVLIFKSWPLKIFYVEFAHTPPFCPCHVSTRFLILFRYSSKCSIKQCISSTSGKSVLFGEHVYSLVYIQTSFFKYTSCQCCQMVYLKTKNSTLGTFRGSWHGNCWCLVLSFGILCSNLVYFVVNFFPFWSNLPRKNLATLLPVVHSFPSWRSVPLLRLSHSLAIIDTYTFCCRANDTYKASSDSIDLNWKCMYYIQYIPSQ